MIQTVRDKDLMFDCFVAAGFSQDHSRENEKPPPQILWRYPKSTTQFLIRDEDLLSFCYPDISSLKSVTAENFTSDEFTFVITDDKGARIFGFCRRLLPLLKGIRSRYDVGARYPGCLCVLSRHQSCPQLFSHLLMTAQAAFMLGQGAQVQAILERLQAVSPMPSPGESIAVELEGAATPLSFQIPFNDSVASLDAPLTPLLQRLGPRSYLLLLSALLCERRIIFLSQELGLLSLAAHAALAALRPLRWQHMLVPVLPPRLLDYAMAPFPFMLGVQAAHRPALERLALENVIFVDLDSGKMEAFGGMHNPIPDICDINQTPLGMKGQAKIAAAKAQLQQLNQAFNSMKMKPMTPVKNHVAMGTPAESENNTSLSPETTGSGGRSLVDSGDELSPPEGGDLAEGGVAVCVNLLAEVKNIHQRICGQGQTRLQAVRKAMNSTRRYTDLFQDDFISQEDQQLSYALTSLYLYLFGNVRDYTVQRPAPDPSKPPTLHFDQDQYIANWRQRSKDPPHLLRFVEEISSSQMLEQFGSEQIQLMRTCTTENPPSHEDGLFSKCAFQLFSRKFPFSLSNIQHAIRLELSAPSPMSLLDEDAPEQRQQTLLTGHGGKDSATPTPDTSPEMKSGLKIPRLPLRRARPDQRGDGVSSHLHLEALSLTSNTNAKDALQLCTRLCQEAHGTVAFFSILRVVWARLQDCRGMRWRHAFKALSLLRHLLLRGPLAVWSDSVDRLPALRVLMKFRTQVVGDAKMVRSMAQEVLSLLLDLTLLNQQRLVALSPRPTLQSPDHRLATHLLRDFPNMIQEVLNHHNRTRGLLLRKQANQASSSSVTPAKRSPHLSKTKTFIPSGASQQSHEEGATTDLLGMGSVTNSLAGGDGGSRNANQCIKSSGSPLQYQNNQEPPQTPQLYPEMKNVDWRLRHAESPVIPTPSLKPDMQTKQHIAVESPVPRSREELDNGFIYMLPTPVPLPVPFDSQDSVAHDDVNGHGGK